MRMWLTDPATMCRRHLLGEHVELHMLAGSIARGKSLAGHLDRGQLAPQLANQRHDTLVREMERREYNHDSPLPSVTGPEGTVNAGAADTDLRRRCKDCARRAAERIDR